ncbi:MAG: hypothetical protein RIC55_34710 [Pirellulaceae bacterium]
MLSVLAIPGALAGAAQGALVGLILGHLIVNVHEGGAEGPPHADVVDILIGAAAGAIIGGALAIRNRGGKRYLLAIWARVALVAACWPFWRLAAMQTQWESRFVLTLTGGWLALVGVAAIVQVLLRPTSPKDSPSPLGRAIASAGRRRWMEVVVYGSAAAAVLVLGAFLSGSYTARFTHSEEGVRCELTRSRWLGAVVTERLVIDHIHGWRRTDGEHAIELLTDDGAARVPGDRAYYGTLAGQISRQLEGFLASSPSLTSPLTLTERTPWAPPPVVVLWACGVLCYGAFLDPLTAFPTALKRTIVAATGCSAAAALVWLLLAQSAAA